MTGVTTTPGAALLVFEVDAWFAVAEHSPVLGIAIDIADFTAVQSVRITVRNGQPADLAGALTTTIEGAALALRAAVAIAAFAFVAGAASEPARSRCPVTGIDVRVANWHSFRRLGVAILDLIGPYLAGAGVAGTIIAATELRLAAVDVAANLQEPADVVIRGRGPVEEILFRIADEAGIGGAGRLRGNVG